MMVSQVEYPQIWSNCLGTTIEDIKKRALKALDKKINELKAIATSRKTSGINLHLYRRLHLPSKYKVYS